MQTLQEVTREVKPAVAFYVGDGQAQRNEAAWQLGYETGMAGQFPQGSEMYEICSSAWDAYADGYEAGRYALAPIFASMTDRNEFMIMIGEDMSEADFMHMTVDNLRSGWLTNNCRLTDYELDAMQAEIIGLEFSTRPFQF